MTTPPRTTSGARLHPLGTDVYTVVLDPAGEEVSERHSGHAWVAVSRGSVEMLFVDDRGGNESEFTLTRAVTHGARVALFIDGDLSAADVAVYGGALDKGGTIKADWSTMYGAMA